MRSEDRPAADEPAATKTIEATEDNEAIKAPKAQELGTADLAERRPAEDATPSTPLFADKEAEGYRSRWLEVQSRFVDAPRESVEAADKLVAEVIQKLAAVFADQQKELESELERSGKLSTEELRLALQRYRSFFDRLLSV